VVYHSRERPFFFVGVRTLYIKICLLSLTLTEFSLNLLKVFLVSFRNASHGCFLYVCYERLLHLSVYQLSAFRYFSYLPSDWNWSSYNRLLELVIVILFCCRYLMRSSRLGNGINDNRQKRAEVMISELDVQSRLNIYTPQL